MAKMLAEDDKRRAAEEKKKEADVRKKMAEVRDQKEKEELEAAGLRRELEEKRTDKERRAAAGYDVSDLSEDNAKITRAQMHAELYESPLELSDEETSTAATSALSPMVPHFKLRIYEYPFADLPSPILLRPQTQQKQSNQRKIEASEVVPIEIPYIVMTLVATESGETLELPGRMYPEGVGADFVPKLTPHVMARPPDTRCTRGI
jgi:hypothetical protein